MSVTNTLHAIQVGECVPESPPAFPYQFRHGLSLVYGLARPISVIVSSDPNPERQTWRHVLRVQIHHGIIARIIRWLDSRPSLPSFLRTRLTAWFPGVFLPDTVVLKGIKPDWDDDFDNEVRMYDRLRPIQGTVVPVFYGVATGCREDRGQEERVLVLSDVGGRQLGGVSYAEHSLAELRGMVRKALETIYRLGVSPTDANLGNCLLVGDRVVVVDHEQDEELQEEDLKEWSLEDIVEDMVDSIMERHQAVHAPKEKMDVEAARRANEKWRARYGPAALGMGLGRGQCGGGGMTGGG